MVHSARKKPLLLCILDGWGHRTATAYNAIAAAATPNFDALWANNPQAILTTDGLAVGLPAGQMGNSEVGHITIGAGRVLLQDLPRIDIALEAGLENLAELQNFIAQAKAAPQQTIHLLGMVSSGGVHSHLRHMAGFANYLASLGFKIFIHAILDGRDRPPMEAADELADFTRLLQHPNISLATICGRYYAMDRDNRWERTELAYNCIVDAVGERIGAGSISAALAASYAAKTGDEFFMPTVLGSYAGMQDGDALLCVNFRADRVRQILSALVCPDSPGFLRNRVVRFSAAAGLTNYGGASAAYLQTLFPTEEITDGLGSAISAAGLTQLRIAETEKFPHVTYYFNGGREAVYSGEERILIPSPKIATYDLQPAMSAPELTQKLLAHINSPACADVIILNFANADMVGHTGNMQAATAAIEALDACLGQIAAAVTAKGGALLITADHGNAEEMWDTDNDAPHTQHSLNPVPFIAVNTGAQTASNGTLADIAPTMLNLLQLPIPASMTGKNLLHD